MKFMNDKKRPNWDFFSTKIISIFKITKVTGLGTGTLFDKIMPGVSVPLCPYQSFYLVHPLNP